MSLYSHLTLKAFTRMGSEYCGRQSSPLSEFATSESLGSISMYQLPMVWDTENKLQFYGGMWGVILFCLFVFYFLKFVLCGFVFLFGFILFLFFLLFLLHFFLLLFLFKFFSLNLLFYYYFFITFSVKSCG